MTTLHALREARAHIVEHGWCQDVLCDSRGRTCMVGALDAVTPDPIVMLDAGRALGQVTGTVEPYGGGPWPARWNDMAGRTVEEVLAAFDRAIEVEESKQGEFTGECPPASPWVLNEYAKREAVLVNG